VEKWGSSRKGSSVTHVVRKGETLGAIALHYHTTVSAIMRLNGMKKSLLIPGQVLVVHSAPASHRKSRARHKAD